MFSRCRFTILSALLLLVPTAQSDGKPAAEKPFLAKCVGISDGDTLTVLRPGPVNVKVRLEGIDAPEKGQPFGQAAKQALSTWAFGRRVQVRSTGKDRWGRLLADVFVGSDWINLRLVENGYAWRFERYSKSATLGAAQKRAQEAGQGPLGREGSYRPMGLEESTGRGQKAMKSPAVPSELSPADLGRVNAARGLLELGLADDAWNEIGPHFDRAWQARSHIRAQQRDRARRWSPSPQLIIIITFPYFFDRHPWQNSSINIHLHNYDSLVHAFLYEIEIPIPQSAASVGRIGFGTAVCSGRNPLQRICRCGTSNRQPRNQIVGVRT